MRVLAILIWVGWLGSFGWLIWAKEIDKTQPWQTQLWGLLIFVILTGMLYGLKRASKGSAPVTASAAAARTRTDDEDMSGMGIEEIEAALYARTGEAERAKALAGWALMLRSPWQAHPKATSWIGGLPRAPSDFVWPLDAEGGRLRFLMQIDLSALKPEPETGHLPPGLPREGALLVFVGGYSYSLHLLTPAEIADAVIVQTPSAPPSIYDPIYTDDPLPCWPVDPVAYLDHDGGRPGFLPESRRTTPDWLDTWGIAGLEAGLAAKALATDIRMGALFFDQLGDKPVSELPPHKQHEHAYREIVRQEGPALLAEIEGFAARAAGMPGSDPVDAKALSAIFARRTALAERIEACVPGEATFGIALDLAGRVGAVLGKLQADFPGLRRAEDLDSIPEGYRGFLAAVITDWRGHRLFGLEAPPPYNTEDLRGQDCLLTVTDDAILQLHTEHDTGVSVWCPRDQMAAGRYDGGQILWHSQG